MANDNASELELRDLEPSHLPLHNASAPPPRSQRQHFLDGLRGLAALLVYIYHHMGWHYGPDNDVFKGYGVDGTSYIAQLPFIRVFFTGGHAAVAIFFVLSGYVLSIGPLRLIKNGQREKCYTGLISASIRRPFRLFVPTAGVSLVFALTLHLPFGLAPKLQFPQALPSLVEELVRWFKEFVWLLNPVLPHTTQGHWFLYDPPAYTMAMEFTGSLFLFGLVACSARLNTRARSLLFLVVWIVCIAAYRWVLAGFAGGMLLALNEIEGFDQILFTKVISVKTQALIHRVVFVIGWYLLSGPGAHNHPEYMLQSPGWKLLGSMIPANYLADEYFRFWDEFGAVLLIYSLMRLSWLQNFFNSRPLQYLGRVSLSFYLVHAPTMYTLGDRIYRFFGRIFQPETTTWFDNRLPITDVGIHGLTTRWLVCQALILPTTLALAEVGTAFLDLPSITIGHVVVKRLGLGT